MNQLSLRRLYIFCIIDDQLGKNITFVQNRFESGKDKKSKNI